MLLVDWLSRPLNFWQELGFLEDEVELCRERATSTTAYISAAPRGSKDPHERIDALLISTAAVSKKAAEYDAAYGEVSAAIEALSDYRQRIVFTKRYLSGASWEEIAESFSLSEDRIRKIHLNALKTMEKMGFPPERQECINVIDDS